MKKEEFREWKKSYDRLEQQLENILLTIDLPEFAISHDEVDETADTFSVSEQAATDILMKDIDTLQKLTNKIKKTLTKQRKLLSSP